MYNIISLELDEIDQLAKVRAVLESYAIEEVVDNATNEQLEELSDILEHMQDVYISNDAGFDLDLVFHLKIAAFSGNQVLKSVLTKLIVDSMNLLTPYSSRLDEFQLKERMKQAIIEHENIIIKLKERDKKGAVSALQTHFNNSRSSRNHYHVY